MDKQEEELINEEYAKLNRQKYVLLGAAAFFAVISIIQMLIGKCI